MITIGVDAHKRLHVAVAVDEQGRRVGEWHGSNNPRSWNEMFSWAESLGEERRWGIEGSGNYGKGLAQALVLDEEEVFEVNSRLTAHGRRHARKRDKNDRLDAEAVARVTLQDHEELPAVGASNATGVLDMLSREREAAVEESTRLRNRIHFLLFHIDPEYEKKLPDLTSAAGLKALLTYTASSGGYEEQIAAGVVRRNAERLKLATDQAKTFESAIRNLTMQVLRPLMEIYGISYLSAGVIAGILGPGKRFKTDAQLASFSGAAPLEASSSGKVRHRLNRTGDRRLNRTFHRIVLTQSRGHQPAKDYLRRRMAEGKTWKEAVRALKRYIARAVLKAWNKCNTENIDLNPALKALT